MREYEFQCSARERQPVSTLSLTITGLNPCRPLLFSGTRMASSTKA